MDALLAVLPALLLISMVWGFVSMRDVRRTAEAWKRAADELGLKCEKVGG